MDREASLFFLPGEYLIVWAGIALGSLIITFLLSYIKPMPAYVWQVMTIVLSVAHFILFGNEPWKFGGKLIRPKNWVRGYPEVKITKTKKGVRATSSQLVTPVKSTKVGKGKQRRKLDPVEKDFELVCPVEVRLRGQVAGGYLLQKGSRLRFVWRFDCRGVATYTEAFEELVTQLQEGLRDLPEGEALTVRAGSFARDRERQAELAALEANPVPAPIRFLTRSQRSRTQRLRRAGRFNPKYLHIDTEYTLEESHAEAADGIERAIHSVFQLYQQFAGESSQAAQIELESAIRAAYNEGFLNHWEFFAGQVGAIGTAPDGSGDSCF